MIKPFLRAKWTNLIFLNYAVSEGALTPYLPSGLELDRWDGKAYVSLVAFDFSETQIRGMAIPAVSTLRDFPEINFRFYVRENGKRGVVFIREFVPNPVIAGVARASYHEPYHVAKMSRLTTPDGDGGRIERHNIIWQGKEQSVSVSLPAEPPETPFAGTFSPWITEQSWGYGSGRKTMRFRVQHPAWQMLPVSGYQTTLDFAALFGERWHFLHDRAPDSVLFAEGSPVTVYTSEPIAQK